jgi:predicted  nucleic acid-binding Zn-ribbon protein
MSIEATVQEIRALLQLAELDVQAQELSPETYGSRREASRKRVGTALLARYQTLLDAGRFPVIAAIERSGCSGCHLRLPTMVASRARRLPAVHTCPHCRRMLYAPELLSTGALRAAGSHKKGAPDRAALASAAERH